MSGNFRPSSVQAVPLISVAALVGAAVSQDAGVTGVTHASDQVKPGDLYAALPGSRRHGAEFAQAAIDAGAVAVLTDRPLDLPVPVLVVADPRGVLGAVADLVYGEPSAKLTIIGITGTAGKTSTAYLIEAGLRAAGRVTGLIGTVETRLGDTVLESVRTTPEAPDLHALFALALERGVTTMVMEVSSHALAMGRVGGVRFDVVGWTNFGTDHLDFHTDSADYFAAKAKLFDGRAPIEILNLDDEALTPLLKAGTVTYSASGARKATWRAAEVTDDGFGQTFTAYGPMGHLTAGVSLPGRHNIANALLALAALAGAGVRPEVAAAGVAACPGVPGRLERVKAPGEIIGVVDYAHKTDAIVAVLAALRELAQARSGRVICVLGAGGDRDKGKRPHMGSAAAQGSDLLIVTDDNPRTEDPAAIRAAVMAGARAFSGGGTVIEIPGRREAIVEAVHHAKPGDIVALLGKGHERGQEINGETLPFDDRVELTLALKAAQA
ncbi:UDP-N-acetylmuramoyl-L-alanyl-D-glutamate--2,6-diaminopimelate ligase [Rhizocola hellebori]|uniref:UDP-N-acetylmuramoyl-L-alanyl-D-glutamate--2,6-diaminopimelate ligase n=1 Tax=Rhizocola hellebori TaxID=1392758 RepID=A0A8J3Q657_9ACTN|nr:UDP-N-acetylmuramoyl-L-alanyl-D-glutamate--2,6-diaminopimelate ligase [Rhizocola hellebori]